MADFAASVTAILTLETSALAQAKHSEEDRAKWEPQIGLLIELGYCYLVDRYLGLLSDVLALLYGKRPEMLKSNETVTFEFILSHESMDDLVTALIERRVMGLAFLGMKSLASYFERKLDLPLFPTNEDFEAAMVAVEIRNLFVHNKGIVNRVFQERVPSWPSKIGEKLQVTGGELSGKYGTSLIKSAGHLQEAVHQKFGLMI